MTAMRSTRDPRPPVRWRPSPRRLAALMAAAFVGISGFLGLRIATGEDPAVHQASVHGSAVATTSSGGSASSAVQSVISSVVSLVSDGEGDDGAAKASTSTANPSTSSSGG